MIDIVRKFFGKNKEENVSLEDKKEETHDVRIAACAVFLEMANIDGEFSEEEQENIIALLKKEFQLTDECAAELMESAHRELKDSIDLWQFTNLINQNYSYEERVGIIEMIWRIVYADGKLDKHENYLMHKLTNLLRLSQKDIIAAKMKVLGKD